MNHYKTFGLNISSAFSLNLPRSENVLTDIEITNKPSSYKTPVYEWELKGSAQDLTFYWSEAGWFTIANGNSINANPIDQPGPGVIEDSLLGECLGVALVQRNELVLHASAIETPNGALIFSGDSGLGKSTLAYTALQAGGRVLADDLTVIRMIDGIPHVIPGPSWLKVRETAIRSAGNDPSVLPIAFAESEKYRVETEPAKKPVPIKSLIILDEGTQLNRAPCPEAKAFMGLMENSFAAHLQDSYEFTFMDTHIRKRLFEACEELVRSTDISVLTRGREIPSSSDLMSVLN